MPSGTERSTTASGRTCGAKGSWSELYALYSKAADERDELLEALREMVAALSDKDWVCVTDARALLTRLDGEEKP